MYCESLTAQNQEKVETMSLARKRLKKARRMNAVLRAAAINEALTIEQARFVVHEHCGQQSEKQIEEAAQMLFTFSQQWASRHHTQFDLSAI
jgi:hypothetical protein